MHTNIFIFGDSIAFGKYDIKGGWVNRLNLFLEENFFNNNGIEYWVHNLSIARGETTADVIARFESETRARIFQDRPNVVIFAIGINDSAYLHDKNGNWVLIEDFQNNILNLIKLANKFSKIIVFVGLTQVDQTKVDPAAFDENVSYRNENIKHYDQILQILAKENGAGYIPIFDKFEANDYKKLLYDGAHPNSAGHELIFETARDYLLEKKII
jgi:lysophospholipase L1-like esterase